MIKTILALSVVAALGAAMPAYAQQMTNSSNGEQVDGHGAGGSQQNQYKHDGPGVGYRTEANGTCYFHTDDGSQTFVVRCAN
jgi:hypothetical protein